MIREPGPGEEGRRIGEGRVRTKGGRRTCLIYMLMHNMGSQWAHNDPSPVLPKCGDKHTMVPGNPFDEPQSMFTHIHAGEVALEGGGNIVCVRKVRVLCHIHLAEHCEQALLLDEVVDLVIERYGEYVHTLQVIQVVPTNEGDNGVFRGEDQVPPRCKLDETYPRQTT
jgi:hypothetical protein